MPGNVTHASCVLANRFQDLNIGIKTSCNLHFHLISILPIWSRNILLIYKLGRHGLI